MKRVVLLFLFISSIASSQKETSSYITKLGNVTFLSYTNIENIEATNTTTICVLDIETGDIALNIPMKAFVFENEFMQEHFNESYMESDLYPKATFRGRIFGFDPNQVDTQIRSIEGQLTLKDRTAPLVFKVKIDKTKASYTLSGTATVLIEDYPINIPILFSPNISKNILVSFTFVFKDIH